MIGLFIPIFLFERLNYSVQNVLIFFIVSGALFGFLVSSPKEAAKRILQLVKNPQLGKKLGEVVRETVKEKFLMPRFLRDYLKLFKEVIK